MSLSIQCPQCGAKLKAREELAGRSVPCPKCKTPIVVQIPEMDDLEVLADEPVAAAPAADPLFDLGNIDLGDMPAAGLSVGSPTIGAPLPGDYANTGHKQQSSAPSEAENSDPSTKKLLLIGGGVGLAVFVGICCGVWMFLSSRNSEPEIAKADPAVSESQNSPETKSAAPAPTTVAPSSSSAAAPTPSVGVTEAAANTTGTTAPPAAKGASSDGSGAGQSPNGSIAPPDVVQALKSIPRTNERPSESPPQSSQPPSVELAATPTASAFSIDRLKAATVFIKVTDKRGGQSGSGFLIERSGDRGVIATNAHVVKPESGTAAKIECVFHSGTSQEKIGTAEIVALDESEDLAILSVQHAELPEPLECQTDLVPTETLGVLVVGFPFGDALTTNRKNPAITISKGSVSSIRRDEYERIALVQIDGGINPGNSGGPVVTEDGKLIGVAVAKVRGADIGFAIPRTLLAEVLLGRVTRVGISGPASRGTQQQIIVEIVDPKKNVTEVAVLTCPVADVSVKAPQPNGTWSKAHTDMAETQLTLNGNRAQGSFSMSTHPSGCMLQVRLTRKNGNQVFAPPVDLKVLRERKTPSTPRPPESLAGGDSNPGDSNPGGSNPGDSSPFAEDDATRKVVRFPAPYATMCVGGSGRYLCLHLPTLKKLAIVDLETRATIKFMDVGEEVVCAAGANKLVVVVPTQKIIQRWSLETFEREMVKTLDIDVPPTVLAMGSASDGPILIGGGDGHPGGYQLLDLKTLKPIQLTYDEANRQRFEITAQSLVRASADGHTFTTWRTATSPSGFFVLHVDGTRVSTRYEHDSVGYIAPSPDGSRIYTASGIYTPQIKLIGQNQKAFATSFPVPSVTGRFFLRISRGDSPASRGRGPTTSVSIHLADQDGALLTIPNVDMRQGEYSDLHAREQIALDQRFCFHPSANVLATLPPSNDCVVFRELNLDEELDKTGVDYLYVVSQPPRSVQPGKAFEYQINAKSKRGGIKYNLSAGPSKMEVSPEGLVKWTPTASDEPTQNIIVVVSDDSGQEIFHTFEIEVNRPGGSVATKAAKAKSNPEPAPSKTKDLSSEKMRTWTDTSGRTLTGTLIRIDGDRVIIKRDNGQNATVKVEQLSRQDQTYIRSRSRN